jgi:hypothetical protein
MIVSKNGKAHVLEISNRANIQTINTDAVLNINNRIDNHIGINNTNAHEIVNIFGLQAALDNKADELHMHNIGDIDGLQLALNSKQNSFTGYTGSLVVITGVNFTNSTTITKTINVNNGIITSIS